MFGTLTTMTLSEFIVEEMKRLEITSVRQFAEFIGVTHPTVLRLIDDPEAQPTLDFLGKLAKATKTDIRTLVSMVLPDAVITQSVDAVVLAEKISRLPKEKQEIIDALINGKVF
jgi:transcriptional regulator with XRE-family HTH domain